MAKAKSDFRFITTRMHGIMDLGMVAILLAAPFALGFATGGAKQWLPMGLAVVLFASSMLTRYELGMIGLIPMPMHLMLDVGAGLLLAASPWLFGFSGTVYWPHLILGLIEVGTAAMTQLRPARGPMFA